MALTYRRPGVYLEESLLVSQGGDIASTVTAGCFIGVAEKGPGNTPTLVESWPDYVRVFGGFDLIEQPPAADPNDQSDELTGGPYPDLASLKASPTEGDTFYNGAPFTAGHYVLLGDGSKAHTPTTGATSSWAAGPMAGTPDPIPVLPRILSYLPFAVYSFFQNGGRFAWIIRSVPTSVEKRGLPATVPVNQPGPGGTGTVQCFRISALSSGVWGNNLAYQIVTQDSVDDEDVFTLRVYLKNAAGYYERVESFSSLTVSGKIAGTQRVDIAINDPNNNAGSAYIFISEVNADNKQPSATAVETPLIDGLDPSIPTGLEMAAGTQYLGQVEGPINLNIVGYIADASKVNTEDVADFWEGASVDPATEFEDREDIVCINDNAPPRAPLQSSDNYMGIITSTSYLQASSGSSYVGSYGPWILVPDPNSRGATVAVPPGGAVMGTMSRIDATTGVFRAPAGVVAGLSNAVGVQTKFTDTQLGDLNARNVNMIRSVVGAGICVMGARTRKAYGVDRYISARRTLISIKESLRRSTQWAVFENNDEMLWASLRMTADRILRPLWERGGLRGVTTDEAYFILCDETINTATVIQSGEVRMEVGVALQYPAEFVIIRITQFDRGTFTGEVQPPR
jgi:uncharacterized protein